MSYKQLVQPDLSATGRLGWCLEYAGRVFHTTQVKPTAWNAWQAAEYPHQDAIPTDCAVPLWFSFYSTINGVAANYGHVVISVPGQGFYSSPWHGNSSFAVLPSIAEVERIYGAQYVGWSEDILGVRVIEPNKEVNEMTPELAGAIQDLKNHVLLIEEQMIGRFEDLKANVIGRDENLDKKIEDVKTHVMNLEK